MVVAIIVGVFGIVMMAVAVCLWRQFGSTISTSAVLVYGCFLLLLACSIWRKRSQPAGDVWRTGYCLTSSALFVSALISLLTVPSIASLPPSHPKTLSFPALVVAGCVFAAKARKKKSAA